MPTVPTYVAFWGIGTLEVDGAVPDDGTRRLTHVMTTCSIRTADTGDVTEDDTKAPGGTDLITGAGLDDYDIRIIDAEVRSLGCDSDIHTHVVLFPVQVGPGCPCPSKVPTDFDVMTPGGVIEQPFLHIMFENIELDDITVDGDEDDEDE